MAVTLGISLGTRTVGLAVVEGKELLDWRIRTFKGEWSTTKCMSIIKAITQTAMRYGATKVCIKHPPERHSSTSIKELILWLTNTFPNCTLYTVKDLKRHYTDARSGKQVFIDSLAKEYPELLQAYHKEKKNRNVYYDKVFEALACARIEAGL